MSVQSFSHIRQGLDSFITFINSVTAECNQEGAGRELALVKTKIQEARMWAGQGLSHYETGFVPSDQAEKPETASKDLSLEEAKPEVAPEAEAPAPEAEQAPEATAAQA